MKLQFSGKSAFSCRGQAPWPPIMGHGGANFVFYIFTQIYRINTDIHLPQAHTNLSPKHIPISPPSTYQSLHQAHTNSPSWGVVGGFPPAPKWGVGGACPPG
jgi:hypothetical protein